MASSRRKQDDKHLKILRDLVSQPQNRTCFDCQQKGPTYINMTIGSFVCTSCSGILRGLNPPHRVKSISMASFTSEEVDQIKSRGNQYCQAVWMGLHDNSKSNIFTDFKDEHKVRDFMISKYERKRYYVDPSIAFKLNANFQPKSDSSSAASTPGSDSKSIGGGSSKSNQNVSLSRPVPSSQKSGTSVTSNGIHQSSSMKGSSSMDLLNSLANPARPNLTRSKTTDQPDPFNPPNNTPQSSEGFANFDNATIFSSASLASPAPNPQLPFSSSPLLPFSPSAKPTTQDTPVSEDRYAALKDLDEAFKTQAVDLPQNPATPSAFGTSPSAPTQPTPGGALFSSSPVNGTGGGLFPANSSSNQGWNANFPSHNPFYGNGTQWNSNGQASTTNSQPQNPNQVNPFARGPDTTFNSQFIANFNASPNVNGASTNGGWPTAGANTPYQNGTSKNTNPWGPTVSTPNPFSTTPTVPSASLANSSFNPFL